MKKLFLLSAIAVSGLIYNNAEAQFRIHIGLNLTPRRVVYVPAPAPEPVVVEQAPVCEAPAPADYSYDDDYYYLPDYDAYYNIETSRYYFNDGRDWVAARYLPGCDDRFDIARVRRFEIRASQPYLHSTFYRSRFNGYGGNWAHNGREFYNHYNNNIYRGYDNNFRGNRSQVNYGRPQDNRYHDPRNDMRYAQYDGHATRY